MPAFALISTSGEGIDSLPDKIYDDLTIADKYGLTLKLNEIGGDLILSSENINVSAKLVSGNVNAIGSRVYIDARVLQSIRICGNKVSTDAKIGRNLSAIALPLRRIPLLGSKIEILRNCTVAKDADLSGAEVIVDGEISGNLHVIGELVVIRGIIRGDVTITAMQKLVLEPSCRIEGTLSYRSPKRAEIQEGAQVISGKINYLRLARSGLFDLSTLWRIILAFGALLVGLVFTLTCRPKILELTEILTARFGQSLGIGLAGAAGMILYALLFVTTFIFSMFYKPVFALVPLLLIAFIIFCLTFYLASILAALFVGRIIVIKITGRKECSPGRSIFLGLLIMTPIYAIPHAGIFIQCLAAMLGFGAISIACYRQIKKCQS